MSTAVSDVQAGIGLNVSADDGVDDFDFPTPAADAATQTTPAADGGAEPATPAAPAPAATPAPETTPAPTGAAPTGAAPAPEVKPPPMPEAKPPMKASQPSPPPEDDANAWPADLLQEVGMSHAQARVAFGTPDALANAVRMSDWRMLQEARAQAAAGKPDQAAAQAAQPIQPPPTAVQPGRQAAAPSAAPPQPAPAATPVPADRFPKFQVPSPKDGSTWDQDVLMLVDELNKHWTGILQQATAPMDQLRQQNEFLAQRQLVEAQREYRQQFEEGLAELGEGFNDVFGTGTPGTQLGKDSPQLRARLELDAAAHQLNQTRVSRGLAPLDLKSAQKRVAPFVFPEQYERSVQQQVGSQVAGRRSQYVARPTQRKTTGLTPEERAAQFAQDWEQKVGVHRDEGPPIEDDGF